MPPNSFSRVSWDCSNASLTSIPSSKMLFSVVVQNSLLIDGYFSLVQEASEPMPSWSSNNVSNGFVLKYFTNWLSGFWVRSVSVHTAVLTGSNPNTFQTSLLASSDGNLYVGYIDGFAILSPHQDSIQEFYTTNDGLCSNFIGCITEDDKGHIWLGSNSGISRYSRHQHLFYNYYIAGSNRSSGLK